MTDHIKKALEQSRSRAFLLEGRAEEAQEADEKIDLMMEQAMETLDVPERFARLSNQ